MELLKLFKNPSAFYKPEVTESYILEGLKSIIFACIVPPPSSEKRLTPEKLARKIIQPLITWLDEVQKEKDYLHHIAMKRRFAWTIH